MSAPTRYRCSVCGNPEIERQYYVWRREDLDDPEAFDLEGAEPCDMGSDWFCGKCDLAGRDPHPLGEEYADIPAVREITITVSPELAAILAVTPITHTGPLAKDGALTHEKRQLVNTWVDIKRRLRREVKAHMEADYE